MAKQDWEHIWSATDIDLKADIDRIESETKTERWRQTERLLKEHFGGFEGLKTLEVGSGMGDFSLLFNRRGAKTTLTDYSPEALAKAQARFEAHGRKASFKQADMLNVPKELVGKFDLSFSLGLAEHFSGQDRYKIIEAHAAVLKPGGLTLISVPYRYSFPYRMWMASRIRNKTWEYGLEIPFSRGEITKLAEKSGFKTMRPIQSSFFYDLNNFFPWLRIQRVAPWLIGLRTPLDFFGYALVYVGEKR